MIISEYLHNFMHYTRRWTTPSKGALQGSKVEKHLQCAHFLKIQNWTPFFGVSFFGKHFSFFFSNVFSKRVQNNVSFISISMMAISRPQIDFSFIYVSCSPSPPLSSVQPSLCHFPSCALHLATRATRQRINIYDEHEGRNSAGGVALSGGR